jgi:hypothetical protein
MNAMYMESSLPESWYPERQSSEDWLVSCEPLGVTTASSECDRWAPDTNSFMYVIGAQNANGIVRQLSYYTILTS